MRVVTIGTATVLALALAAPAAAADSASALYRYALAHDAAARARLNSDTRHPAATLRAIRAAVTDYERVVLRYPRSGYCDNALWRGARLASDAFTFFGQVRDRRTAVRLIHWLQTQYPASRYAHRAPGAALPPRVARRREPAARKRTPAHVSPPRAPHDVVAPADRDTTLQRVTRSVLPGRVRVAIELSREALYEQRRLDDPARLVFDFEATQPTAAMGRADIDYRHAHVVRDVRVAGVDDNRTQVTIDLTGVTSYTTFALYNPYRLVVDCRTPDVAGSTRSRALGAGGTVRPAARLAASAATDSVFGSLPTVYPRPVAPVGAAAATPSPPPTSPPPAATAAPVAKPTPRRLTVRPYPVVGRHKPPPSRRTHAPAGPPPPARAAAAVHEAPAAPGHTQMPGSRGPSPSANPGATPASPPPPATNLGGGFSMARQLGLGVSRIVIDPGHGGRDPGAQANGLTEANLVLDIALRLQKLLQHHGGFDVILTRRTNVFVPLWRRTEIANQADADLFLSIHANASPDPQAHGIETFFLNFASNPEESAVAARENATSGQSMGNLSDLVKTIALNNKLDESRDFATMVQRAMYSTLRVQDPDARNLGVKQAPFDVLIGASMPSVLAEVSFVTNRQDAHYLKEGSYRERIAEALYRGILRYRRSLKSFRTADNQ